MNMNDLTPGAALIAAERERQVSEEGWSPEHDDYYSNDELTEAAACYVHEAIALQGEWANYPRCPADRPSENWPWHVDWWKPSDDPIRNLVKAGALIAAEIDRLKRAADGE